jgi:peroxisomal enoyl-CoA hydratase 2
MNAFSLNGDYNRLHVTQELGKSMGFGGPIMHGLFTYNVACHAVLKELGNGDPANMKEFSARFAAPVKPGDKLVTEMWRTGEYREEWEDVRFLTRVEGGKTVLSNGRALMKPVNTGSKI